MKRDIARRSGHPTEVVLLLALVCVEMTTDELIVLRRSAILPARRLRQLPETSRSGLAAAMILVMIFTSSGMAGVSHTFAFSHHPSQVLLICALIMGLAGIIGWLVRSDARPWLSELTV